jgi:threonine dehydratase
MVPQASIPTIDDIRAAQRRLEGRAHRTPVMRCAGIDAMAGAELHFKCENFQKVGAFKFRGACNAVLMLTDQQAARGVVTHSSGNHAAALALAARTRGIPAYLVMPSDVTGAKKRAVEAYGGNVILCEPTLAARDSESERVRRETGAAMVHPFDNPDVIAGQGTIALELHEQVPGLDALVVPVSGGGVISGIALATRAVSPGTLIFAAEPQEVDDARQSFVLGRRVAGKGGHTIADGLRAGLSDRTFSIIARNVHDVITVNEPQIILAMRLIWERMKIIVEPSAAVALAAVLNDKERFAARRIGIILTGGNVDLDRLPWSSQ